MEDGDGQSRDAYLLEHRIKTFLIVAPQPQHDLIKRKQSVCLLKKSNKWTECGFGSDKPFSNISETVIARNVTQTVSHLRLNYSIDRKLIKLLMN